MVAEGKRWQAMVASTEETLAMYAQSNKGTRDETRQILGDALSEIEPRSLESQALAYLIGRLDGIEKVDS